ncbi:MAG: hypothetical protein B6I38_04445 [Anaerolineaceae bacterium 4572_5.1]|nr:MAG: hypothetical protein B5M51_00890 [Anaerolinea sp. 4484_236]OQY32583.1 MAG: hypothetical protein B6I38_04445 [Anaerolineaceae bacterium 4572_5.1]
MTTQYQLVMRTGPTPGTTYPLDDIQTTLGRDPSNTISINDAEISRHHARMTLQGGKIVLEDMGSTNGTSVDGKRISGPHVLKAGEMVSFGEEIVLIFEALNFDPDATVVSSRPISTPRQEPIAPPPPRQAYAGQVPTGPASSAPVSQPAKRSSLPIIVGAGAVLLICACGTFLWWIDATYRWCTFFPFLFPGACG